MASGGSMGGIALVLYGLYGVFAFGLRSLVQYRRTGSAGFRGLSGRPGSAEFWGGVLFSLALVLGPAGCVVAQAGVLAPLALLDRPGVRMAGLSLFGAGFAATLGAQFAMGNSWRIGVDAAERTALVTSGPFRIVRNPIFSTMMLTIAGSGLMVPNTMVVGAFVLLFVGLQIHVRLVEEPYLRSVHGADYLAYAARTGRFVPLIGKIRID